MVALGQRLRRFADDISNTVGKDHGKRVRHWFEDKKSGWYAVLADPQMPAMSTVLDQAHNAIDRKLFMMKGFHSTFRTLFRPSEAILEGPPADIGGGLYTHYCMRYNPLLLHRFLLNHNFL